VLIPRGVAWLWIVAVAIAIAIAVEAAWEWGDVSPSGEWTGLVASTRRIAASAGEAPARDAPAARVAVPGEEVASPAPRLRLVLVGIGSGIAVLHEAGGSRMWTVRQGDRVEGMLVASVGADRVKLVAPSLSEEVVFGALVAEPDAKPRGREEARVVARAEGATDDESAQVQSPFPVPPRPQRLDSVPTAIPVADLQADSQGPPKAEGASDDEASGP
jgi:hypothetical protein